MQGTDAPGNDGGRTRRCDLRYPMIRQANSTLPAGFRKVALVPRRGEGQGKLQVSGSRFQVERQRCSPRRAQSTQRKTKPLLFKEPAFAVAVTVHSPFRTSHSAFSVRKCSCKNTTYVFRPPQTPLFGPFSAIQRPWRWRQGRSTPEMLRWARRNFAPFSHF